MTVPEFLAWAAAQPRGRYELVRGEVVAMAPERARHNLVKAAVFRALSDAVARAGLPCTVFTDGMTVVIDNEHSREPDAAVQCNVSTDLDSMILESAAYCRRSDLSLVGARRYWRQAGRVFLSSQHSPLSDRQPDKQVVVHHARDEDGEISTRIMSAGQVDLAPPGMTVPVRELLPEV